MTSRQIIFGMAVGLACLILGLMSTTLTVAGWHLLLVGAGLLLANALVFIKTRVVNNRAKGSDKNDAHSGSLIHG